MKQYCDTFPCTFTIAALTKQNKTECNHQLYSPKNISSGQTENADLCLETVFLNLESLHGRHEGVSDVLSICLYSETTQAITESVHQMCFQTSGMICCSN